MRSYAQYVMVMLQKSLPKNKGFQLYHNNLYTRNDNLIDFSKDSRKNMKFLNIKPYCRRDYKEEEECMKIYTILNFFYNMLWWGELVYWSISAVFWQIRK